MKTASVTVFEGIKDVWSWVSEHQAAGRTVGFVPTMGALHAGHVSLIDAARQKCDRVVVSIFVNPTQFNNADDLAKYPRTRALDMAMLEEAGCDVLFHPEVSEMYPQAMKGHWNYGPLSETLEGYYRPGHFDGVLTIVKKLFEAVHPDYAFFGEKDYQQLALIRTMTKSEGLDVNIVGCPSIREPSGLAMSSRNMRLSASELRDASAISRVLFSMRDRRLTMMPRELVKAGRRELEAAQGIVLEYLEMVDALTFEPVTDWSKHDSVVVLTAVYVGAVRLIDNVSFESVSG